MKTMIPFYVKQSVSFFRLVQQISDDKDRKLLLSLFPDVFWNTLSWLAFNIRVGNFSATESELNVLRRARVILTERIMFADTPASEKREFFNSRRQVTAVLLEVGCRELVSLHRFQTANGADQLAESVSKHNEQTASTKQQQADEHAEAD